MSDGYQDNDTCKSHCNDTYEIDYIRRLQHIQFMKDVNRLKNIIIFIIKLIKNIVFIIIEIVNNCVWLVIHVKNIVIIHMI